MQKNSKKDLYRIVPIIPTPFTGEEEIDEGASNELRKWFN